MKSVANAQMNACGIQVATAGVAASHTNAADDVGQQR
jgi:hypothetical protein